MPAEKPIPLNDLTPDTVKLEDLPRFPEMSGWFKPGLLLKLAWRVFISDVFGAYADRRLIVAALDTSNKRLQRRRADLMGCAKPDHHGAIWIDYVADLGDGFDATYAIAFLLAQPSLVVDGAKLPRGSLLIFGGDEAYPHAGRDEYTAKVRKPYSFASPDDGRDPVPLLALPGNHDWYDGLVTFLAVFCREKATAIGTWRAIQRRSYFAAKVTDDWWIWGIDVALTYDMDQPQADYFTNIACAMAPGSKVILCCSEPGWYAAQGEKLSYRTLGYALWIIQHAEKDISIPLLLSGDTHHYARYASQSGETNYITSGGGGAYLNGTMDLKPELKLENWPHEPNLTLRTAYPTAEESKRMLTGNFSFFPMNVGFSYFLAAAYTVFAFILSYAPRYEIIFGVWLVFAASLFGYLKKQEDASWGKLATVAGLHAVLHTAVVLLLVSVAVSLDAKLSTSLLHLHWLPWLAFLLFWLPVGACFGGVIYGLHLWLTARFFGLNQNDAFSAVRLDSHRHFLRMRILGDSVTVYPVKLDEVPMRDRWRMNPSRGSNKGASVFVADPPLEPRLIEEPIVVRVPPS